MTAWGIHSSTSRKRDSWDTQSRVGNAPTEGLAPGCGGLSHEHRGSLRQFQFQRHCQIRSTALSSPAWARKVKRWAMR